MSSRVDSRGDKQLSLDSRRDLLDGQLLRVKILYQRACLSAKSPDSVDLVLLVLTLDFVVETFLKSIIYWFPAPWEYRC